MQFRQALMAGAVAVFFCGVGHAGVSSEDAHKLGATLTGVGAEMAGSSDGAIPAYTGGLTSAPASFKAGSGIRPDPFASEKPVFSIDAKNMDKYAANLTEGTRALMKKNPGYHIDVYPTHRTAAFPKFVLDNTAKCAVEAKTAANGRSMSGCHAGFPFPMPQSGFEAMWNHLVRFNGVAYAAKYRNYNVDASGGVALTTEGNASEEYPYWDVSRPDADVYWQQRLIYTGPARRAGEALQIVDPLNYEDKGRHAWQYLPGQRRVKVAPDLAFDTPNPGSGGASTFDDVFLFNGSMDRYDFKLVGKKEIFIPYNAYKMAYDTKAQDLLKPNFINPDDVRWERHRVWVVEATLVPGKRHIYSKRTFYLDEDSWAAVASDAYDARGQLFRTGFAYITPSYDIPAPIADLHGIYDLIAGSYSLTAFTGETGGFRYTTPMTERDWAPASLAGSGIR
ncbi:DUF1329 domain-containing protein [Dyella humicola]|uniref:DUF1329 domain-containing protein n=1 Tax=Dyella humicola TaxID=2992126 RepID=UPI002251887A|nr:DUF1329 domain-containing protein [Dyella humicola]